MVEADQKEKSESKQYFNNQREHYSALISQISQNQRQKQASHLQNLAEENHIVTQDNFMKKCDDKVNRIRKI